MSGDTEMRNVMVAFIEGYKACAAEHAGGFVDQADVRKQLVDFAVRSPALRSSPMGDFYKAADELLQAMLREAS